MIGWNEHYIEPMQYSPLTHITTFSVESKAIFVYRKTTICTLDKSLNIERKWRSLVIVNFFCENSFFAENYKEFNYKGEGYLRKSAFLKVYLYKEMTVVFKNVMITFILCDLLKLYKINLFSNVIPLGWY